MQSPYTTFFFQSWDFDATACRISLSYSLDKKIFFTETIDLPQGIPFAIDPETNTDFKQALDALHGIGGTSYYKTFCPREIVLENQTLSQDQVTFWNTVYEKGLGEFFYTNDIDHRGMINFPAGEASHEPPAVPPPSTEPSAYRTKKILVPFGGGKDSIVTLELLREGGADCTLFRMNPHPIISELARIAGLPLLEVRRSLSPNLFELNAQGALNGHVPVTMYVSILGMIVSILYGFEGFAISSERSASEGNVTDPYGMSVNHQWSKSLEAEELLRAYAASHIGTRVALINLLRPHSELAIAKSYSSFPQYFTTATSCNTNWKLLDRDPAAHRWCGHCPKCAFCFALFAPFIPETDLLHMFGQNLFERDDLLPLYRKLLGIEGSKPFECVGTKDETKAAFYLATQREEYGETPAGQLFLKEVLPTIHDPETLALSFLTPDYED